MRKANQNTTPTEVIATEADYEGSLQYLDAGERKRETIKKSITRHKRNITNNENYVTHYQTELEKSKEALAKEEKALADIPENKFGVEGFKAVIDKVASLPWIGNVVLKGTELTVTTVPGVLKTDFYERMVLGDGSRCTELLPEVLTLPLPSYEIRLALTNMGGTWANNNALSIKLAMPSEYSSFTELSCSWSHEPHAHWGSHDNRGGWATLCLGDYDRSLTAAGKEGIVELLSELAIYLQQSGWASAYRNKLAWSILLGNPVYNKYLTRGFNKGETIEEIQKAKRDNLQEWLKKNNLTHNQLQYGSLSTDDDDRACYDCDCEIDGYDEDECECDCH